MPPFRDLSRESLRLGGPRSQHPHDAKLTVRVRDARSLIQPPVGAGEGPHHTGTPDGSAVSVHCFEGDRGWERAPGSAHEDRVEWG